MKKILPLLLLALPCCAAGQTVIASGGNYHQGDDNGLSFTIGETVVKTQANATNQLTQGFQQPWVDITTAVEEPVTDKAISVFPNPVRHVLHIAIDRPKAGQRLELCDAAGKLVQQMAILSTMTDLSMAEYASGLYYLRILEANDTSLKTFKISVTQ